MATEYFEGIQFDHISQVIYTTGNFDSVQEAVEYLDGQCARLLVVDSDTLSSLSSGTYSGITLEIQPGVVLTNQVSSPGFSVLVRDGGQFKVGVDTTIPYAHAIPGDCGTVPYVAVDGDETLTVTNRSNLAFTGMFGSDLSTSGSGGGDTPSAPSDPTNLSVQGFYGYIFVGWDHGGENDLHHFLIYRNSSSDFSGASVIKSVEAGFGAGNQSFCIDIPADLGTYYYWVSAVNTNDDESGAAGPESDYKLGDPNFATPEEFGAAGDGSTDDRAAIQSALDDGRPVFFNRNTVYAIGSTINKTFNDTTTGNTLSADIGLVPNYETTVYGNDAQLKATTSMKAVVAFVGDGGQQAWQTLKIQCNGNADVGWFQNDNPSESSWSPYLHLIDIKVNDFLKHGFIISTFVSQFDRLEASGNEPSNGSGIIVASPGWFIRAQNGNDDPSGLAATSLTMNSCWGHKCSSAGIEIHGITNSSLNGCASDGNNHGYYFRDKVQGVSMNGCGCERCNEAIVAYPEDHEITMNIHTFFALYLGATSSSAHGHSWLQSSAPYYYMRFSGAVGVINVIGFTVVNSDNDPQTATFKVKDDDSLSGLELFTTAMVKDYSGIYPTAQVWPNSEAHRPYVESIAI